VFLAGVAALAGMVVLRPFRSDPAGRQWREDLAAIRKALDPKDPDTSRALAIGEDLLDQIDRFPAHRGEIHFLVGTAYLRRTGEVTLEQATYICQKAREHLEAAAAENVPDTDQPRLRYRLARVWFLSGVDPQRIIDIMSQVPESTFEDANEAYGMLTQLYLNLPQPNVQAALDTNAKQLNLRTDNDDILEPVRCQRGELLLRLNRKDEARAILARIRRDAPGGLYARARLMRAHSCQQDGLWKEAVPLWEEILKEAKDPSPDAGHVLYYLGVCYRRLKRTRDAARVWEEALKEDAPSAQAAALGLAELKLLGPSPGSALEYFERCLQDVKAPSDFHNPLIDLAEVRRQIENGSRSYAQAGDFERAVRLAQLTGRIAPGSNRESVAEFTEAWAQECLNRASHATGSCATRRLDEARAHFRDAGAAYEALANASAAGADQVKRLWASARCYYQGQHFAQAAGLLQRYLKSETSPQGLAQAWYFLAEIYRAVPDEKTARTAYLKCIEYPGALAFRARFRLAQADLEAAKASNDVRKLDDAEKALEQNLDLMRSTPDEEAYEQTLLALADLLMERQNYRLAAVRLQEALDRYPGNPRQVPTRLQLANCCRRLAAQEEQLGTQNFRLTEQAQLHHREQRRLWLERAVAHYQKLVTDLSARSSTRPLADPDAAVLRQALFAVAECYFEQGQYSEAILFYERIVSRYPRRPDALTALKQITRFYMIQQDRQKAMATVQRVRGFLQEVQDLPNRADEERWLEWAAKAIGELPNPPTDPSSISRATKATP
jgi:tetratricopeptide (TPR) repeat protein